MAKSTKMTTSAAARIQSGVAKVNEGAVPKGYFAGRAQRGAAHNSNRGGE